MPSNFQILSPQVSIYSAFTTSAMVTLLPRNISSRHGLRSLRHVAITKPLLIIFLTPSILSGSTAPIETLQCVTVFVNFIISLILLILPDPVLTFLQIS